MMSVVKMCYYVCIYVYVSHYITLFGGYDRGLIVLLFIIGSSSDVAQIRLAHLPFTHVNLYKSVGTVRVQALKDLLTRDGFKVDVELREARESAEIVLIRFITCTHKILLLE